MYNNGFMTILEIAKARDTGTLRIPELQRGLVWNASRMEALWDSILRGIPIGAISIRKGELLDGQQRYHAITTGLGKDRNINTSEILWLDLNPVSNVGERKFAFYVTTMAHPWGYKQSADEKSNLLLCHAEQRRAIEEFNAKGYKWERSQTVVARPYPCEMWPWKANLPVPFSVIYQFALRDAQDGCLENFVVFVREIFSKENWSKNFLEKVNDCELSHEQWNQTVAAIRSVCNYKVVIVNADCISNDADVALYFKRMNKNGEEPPEHEIQYSMLKSRLPELKKLDEYAVGFSSPSILASLAMTYYKIRKQGKYVTVISSKDVQSLASDNQFSKFVLEELPILMGGADALLRMDESNGLLKWHRTRICRTSWQLYMLLMKASENPENDVNYAGLVLLLRLFSKDIGAVIKNIWESDSIREGLRKSFWDGSLEFPLHPNELKFLNDDSIYAQKDWQNNLMRIIREVDDRLRMIWSGFDGKSPTIELLLYSCRCYMRAVFGDYNAADSQWQEQNRPWDYDHVLPKDWIRCRQRSGADFAFTPICHKFLWSIGNSAPIPFSLNRSKNCYSPGENYPIGKVKMDLPAGNGLELDLVAVSKYEKDWGWFDRRDNEVNIKRFVKTSAERIYHLYGNAFKNLDWASLLDFGLQEECRYLILSAASKSVGGDVFCLRGKKRIKLHQCGDAANLLLRASHTLQLCLDVGQVVVCCETDGEHSWYGVCRKNDEQSINEEIKEVVCNALGDGYECDDDWYGYKDLDELTEKNVIDAMIQMKNLVAGLFTAR